MQLYLEGLLFGIVPVFFVGPVLFTLLHASLRDGFAAGFLVAAGIAVSDVCAIALCAMGVGQLLSQPWGQLALQLIGGIILIGFGLAMTFSAIREQPAGASATRGLRLFVAGFVVNFVNPFVFTFWIGALGGVSARHGFSAIVVAEFFAGVITTIFVTDVLKARLADALRRHLTGRAMTIAQRASGVLLAGFGVYLLVRGIASQLPSQGGG